MQITALILAKSKSNRLPNKNILPVNGKPMFITNLEKCLKIFNRVYVSSDSKEILDMASDIGAIPIKRPTYLCGDAPNIYVYQHALNTISEDTIVAVQANSPTIDKELIRSVKKMMEDGFEEIMTCNADYSIYGSIWALTKDRIKTYKDPYKPTPDVLVVDKSIDCHTKEDYNNIIKYYEK